MKYYYSAGNKGFYIDTVHAGKIPADAVEIPSGLRDELLAGERGGGVISADTMGNPILAEPQPAAPTVPHSVSRAQGKAQLIISGLWQRVLDHVDAIDDPTEKALAEVALHDAQEYRRDSPFLNAVADSIMVTEEQKDELFSLASKIAI